MTRRRRGANAVEFALVLGPLLAMLTGILDYGWLYAVRTAASTAAWEGARAGALTARTADPDGAAANAALARWKDLGMPVVAPSIAAFRQGTPSLMVVRVKVETKSLVGLVPGPGTFVVTAALPMEDQP